MPHPLGEVVLLVPRHDAADADQLDTLRATLTELAVEHRTVHLGNDPAATVHRELSGGAQLLVHCGGERSMSDVVAALCTTDGTATSTVAVLGIFPGGRRHDFARTFGLTTSPRAAARLIASDRVLPVDVGVATVTTPGGERRVLVVNNAVVGLGARVARREHRTRVGTLLAWWSALARYRQPHVDVDMTFAEWHAPATEVRLANGQFAHDGLPVAPQALPDDGAWDVQVWAGPKHLPFTQQPRMVRAEHLPHPDVSTWRQKRAVVAATPPALVAVDNRVVGTTPATFELLPSLLRLKI